MALTSTATDEKRRSVSVIERDDAVVRFCGDSGDGMQLVGTQLTNTSAAFGNDVSSFPTSPPRFGPLRARSPG